MGGLDNVGAQVQTKLVNMLGETKAEALVAELMPRLGLRRLETAQDRFRFAELLIERGGILSVLGRSIQTQALLQGAMRSLDAALARARA